MKTFFFFGDSLTLGVNDTAIPGGWVSRFALQAAAQRLLTVPPDTLYNLGARRHSSREIRARWRAELENRVFAGVEPRLVFCFGVSDTVIFDGRPVLPVEESLANARAILTGAMDKTKEMLLISAPPVADAEHRARIGQLNAAYAALCAELTVPYVSLFPALEHSDVYMGDLNDGIHPGPDGCTFFAEQLLAAPAMQVLLDEE